MDEKRLKWKTWWWYHKIHVLIAVAAVAVILYSVLPGLLAVKPDYSVALITTEGVPDETLALLKGRFEEVADDANGDGTILVDVIHYGADLTGETEGTINYMEASRLDADLVGKVSAVFLLDNPEGFRTNTAVAIEPETACRDLVFFNGISLPDEMAVTIRTDSDAQGFYERICREKNAEEQSLDMPRLENITEKADGEFSCSFDGVAHTYIMDLPEESNGAPLVVMLPGYGNTAESFRTAVHFEKEANAREYAVVYVTGAPDPGSPTSAIGWHSEIDTAGNNDAEFLAALVEYLKKEYSLDQEKAYVIGFSNGGLMAHRLAMEDKLFTACVSVAGWMPESVWKARREFNAKGFLQITGEKDKAVPKNSDGSAQYAKAPAIEDVMDYWVKSNGLELYETSVIGNGSSLTKYYSEGKTQQIWNLFVKDGRHSWPSVRFNGVDTNTLILEFFESQNNADS